MHPLLARARHLFAYLAAWLGVSLLLVWALSRSGTDAVEALLIVVPKEGRVPDKADILAFMAPAALSMARRLALCEARTIMLHFLPPVRGR